MLYNQPTQITFQKQIENHQLWYHAKTGDFFIGTKSIEGLTPIQRRILSTLLTRKGVYLSKADILSAAWLDGIVREAVSDDAQCK